MGKGREILCYDYVNHRYAQVRDALTHDALGIFQAATKSAAARAQSVAAALRVDVGGLGVEADIKISVKQVEEHSADPMGVPTTRLELEWESATAPSMFPLMKAELCLYALTATETQLGFQGYYEPPLGPLGKAVNAVVGHRIAEVSVHRFVNDIADYLRRTLPAQTRASSQQ